MKADVLGLKINTESKAEIVSQLISRAKEKQKTIVVTPYSEFFYYAAKDYRFRDMVNAADYSLPDGISIQWLSYYLNLPLTAKSYYLKIVQGFFQEIFSLVKVFASARSRQIVFKEKISGADFYWDIAASATRNGQSIFLLGGFGDTPKIAAQKTLEKFPNLRIDYSNADPSSQEGIDVINQFKPDYLLVAYGPVRQEYWIKENLPNIQATIAIGLGGTFDYIAGSKKRAPRFVVNLGLEWLFRLITQPSRARRIWHATASLWVAALRHKIFDSMEYRRNAAGVIINDKGEIFVASRSRETKRNMNGSLNTPEAHWQLPQGGIEKGEDARQGLLREMCEELGTRKFEILGECSKTYSYDWNHYFRKLLFNSRQFKGQLQYIFYLKFVGKDSDIKLEATEIDQYKWVKPENIKSVIHPMRREMLDVALSELNQYI